MVNVAGLHLPITKLKFTDLDTLTFDVTSTQEEEEPKEDTDVDDDDERKKKKKKKKGKKIFHFVWTLSTQTLAEADDYESPESHPSWGSVSPDGEQTMFLLI